MSEKHTEIALSRRETLKKLGECAGYTGAVVTFLAVSKPAWASYGHGGSKPGCGGGSGNMSISSCGDGEVSSSGSSSKSSYGQVSGGPSSGAQQGASSSSSSGSGSSSSGSAAEPVSSQQNDAANGQVSNGPSYQ